MCDFFPSPLASSFEGLLFISNELNFTVQDVDVGLFSFISLGP